VLWDMDLFDGWIRTLSIDGIALPGLGDFQHQLASGEGILKLCLLMGMGAISAFLLFIIPCGVHVNDSRTCSFPSD
jgi:hypothetical protein